MQPAVTQRNRFRCSILASTATRSQEPLIHGVSGGRPAGPGGHPVTPQPCYAVLTPGSGMLHLMQLRALASWWRPCAAANAGRS
jgi:hypothetical protein